MSEHAFFVLMSYGLGALILAAVFIWLLLDRNHTVKTLAALEEQGAHGLSAEESEETHV